jgi:hypothetical protein
MLSKHVICLCVIRLRLTRWIRVIKKWIFMKLNLGCAYLEMSNERASGFRKKGTFNPFRGYHSNDLGLFLCLFRLCWSRLCYSDRGRGSDRDRGSDSGSDMDRDRDSGSDSDRDRGRGSDSDRGRGRDSGSDRGSNRFFFCLF